MRVALGSELKHCLKINFFKHFNNSNIELTRIELIEFIKTSSLTEIKVFLLKCLSKINDFCLLLTNKQRVYVHEII